MKTKLFLPVGGSGIDRYDESFDLSLWKLLLSKVEGQQKRVALLTTPTTATESLSEAAAGCMIDAGQLVANHTALESELGACFSVVDEERFGAGQYDGQFDVLCITCGNTADALRIWRQHACDQKIQEWYESGIPVTGWSAGFIALYEWASTDSVPGPEGAEFGALECLGIIPGGAIPHADAKPQRIPDFQSVLGEREISPVIALGENTMAIYEDGELTKVVSSQEESLAAWITKNAQTPIPVEKV